MTRLIAVVLLGLCCLGFHACTNNSTAPVPCLPMATNPVWPTENFKSDMLIQFTRDYQGPGMQGFEGNIFFKERIDKQVTIQYAFCGPLWCTDFGQVLANPNATSIAIMDPNGQPLVLGLRKNLCDGDVIKGILFYEDQGTIDARLYIKQGSSFQEAALLQYTKPFQAEVESILQTIRSK